MQTIGEYNPITKEVTKDYHGQGFIYKNFEAFNTKSDDVCYVPELSQAKYNYSDFLLIAGGDHDRARQLFLAVDWQHPETLWHEWVMGGEF